MTAQMTILYCFTKPHPASAESVARYAPQALLTDTSATETSYCEVIASHWNDPGDLIIIEQDIVITETTVQAFEECPEPWCSFEFDVMGAMIPFALGCTKYGKAARELIDPPEEWSWRTLDMEIHNRLYPKGLVPHVHGQVTHLHDYVPGRNRFGEDVLAMLESGSASMTAAGVRGGLNDSEAEAHFAKQQEKLKNIMSKSAMVATGGRRGPAWVPSPLMSTTRQATLGAKDST